MRLMKPAWLFVSLLLGPLTAISAQYGGKPSMFLDTDPMGARIYLDGNLLSARTPTLLRGLTVGLHQLSLWHDGYHQRDLTVDVVDGKVPDITASLKPESAVLAFPADTHVVDSSGVHDTSGRQFRYPDGRYDLTSGETVALKPVFPDEGLLEVAGWAAFLLSTAAAVSIGSDIYHISAGWMDHPSEVSLALTLSTFFELPWYGALVTRKKTFDRAMAPQITPTPEHLDQARDLFDEGDTALQSGDLAKAEPLFARVVKEFPESRRVPGAWFRLARIHLVTGRRELAAGEYRLVADTYPQAAYYDRARKALADLYEAAGDKARAVESLDSLVYNDGFFDPADVAAQKARLQAPPEVPHAP